MHGPKISYSLNAEENKMLDRILDAQIEEGLHPELLENDSDPDDSDE